MIEEAIVFHQGANARLQALIAGRFHPQQAPAGTDFPVVIYGQADRLQLMSLTGVVNLNAYTMELDVWARDYAECKEVIAALRDAETGGLVGYSGAITAPGGTVNVRGVFEQSGDDGAEQPQHADELGLWTAGLTLAIHYGE